MERERKLNINNLTAEQATEISAQLGDKIREICDKAVFDANRILNIYGMHAKMQVLVKEGLSSPKDAPKRKRGRPKKVS